MNIQFPLAALVPQQKEGSSGTLAQGQTGISFADLLGQASKASDTGLAALADEHLLATLPRGEELPGLSFQQSLSLPAQLSDASEAGLVQSEMPEPELPDLTVIDDGAAAVALTNNQALTEGRAAAAISDEQAASAQRIQAQLQQGPAQAAPQHVDQAKAQPVEGSFKLSPEQLDVAAKPVAGQHSLESSALAPGSNLQASAPVAARAVLNAPMASPQWQNDLSQQVSSFVMRGDNRVSLQLNPAELGPLLVELKVVEQNAQLQFVSGQAAVRNAVEQAIPQLRDALAQQGIDLGDVNVGEQSPQREQAQSTRAGTAMNDIEPEADDAELVQRELDTATSASLPGQLSVYA